MDTAPGGGFGVGKLGLDLFCSCRCLIPDPRPTSAVIPDATEL